MQHTALAHFVFATAAVPCFLLLIFMHTLCVHRCNLSSTTHTHHQWQATTSQTEESPSRRQLLSNASILPSILLLNRFHRTLYLMLPSKKSLRPMCTTPPLWLIHNGEHSESLLRSRRMHGGLCHPVELIGWRSKDFNSRFEVTTVSFVEAQTLFQDGTYNFDGKYV